MQRDLGLIIELFFTTSFAGAPRGGALIGTLERRGFNGAHSDPSLKIGGNQRLVQIGMRRRIAALTAPITINLSTAPDLRATRPRA